MTFYKNSNGPKLPLRHCKKNDIPQELNRPKVTIKDTARKMISHKNSTGPKLPLKTLQEKDVQYDKKDTITMSTNFIHVMKNKR